MSKNEFTKNVEKMINPIDVGTIHYMQSYMKFIPKKLQTKIIASGSKKNPYMGFVVEPYSFFLCYKIIDLKYAESLIPKNYRLIKTKMFEDDEANYYCILGAFNVHTSAFWGTRLEFYVIAENTDTGLLSWVIIDYDTNTVSFDQKEGLSVGEASECVLTTNFEGEIIVDIRNNKAHRELIATAELKNAKQLKLDQRLWLEGNLSVSYGQNISDQGQAFAVIFNPDEVQYGLKLPVQDVKIESNTWYPGLCEKSPSSITVFPFAQHFLSDSPGHFSSISNKKELEKMYQTIDFGQFSNYSAEPIKKAMQIGQLIPIIIIFILSVLLIIK